MFELVFILRWAICVFLRDVSYLSVNDCISEEIIYYAADCGSNRRLGLNMHCRLLLIETIVLQFTYSVL